MAKETADLDAGWVQGLLLASAASMLVLSVSSTLPIIPAMLRAFAGQPAIDMLVPFSVVAPMLSLALTGPLAGALGERIGRRPLLNASALVFAVFGVAPYFLTDFSLVVASRVIMGVALGGMITSAVGLTGDYYTGALRQRWLAIQGAAAAVTAVIAASASGALAESNWRLPFLMLAIGFPLFAALIIFRGPSRISPIETAVEAVGEQTTAPAPWRTLVLVFWLGVLASLIIFPPAYAIGVLLEEKTLGSAMLTGITTSVLAAGAVLGAMGLSLLKALSLAQRQAVAFAVAAIGTVAMWDASGLTLFMTGAFAVGIAQGMTSPVLSEWLLNETPLRLRGRVVGLFQTTFFLAQFASPLLAQAVAKALHSTTISMLYYAVACALAFAAIAAVRTRRRAPAPSTAM